MALDMEEEVEGGRRKRRKSRKRGGRGSVDSTTHVASSHEDTTSGAVHCFQDERGNWQTYTFGTDSQVALLEFYYYFIFLLLPAFFIDC